MADAYRDQTDESFVEKSRRDVAEAIGKRMEQLCVRDVMIRDVVTVPPDLSVVKAAQLMMERRIHRLPVVEDGKLVGIVSSLDFTRIVAGPTCSFALAGRSTASTKCVPMTAGRWAKVGWRVSRSPARGTARNSMSATAEH